MGNRLILSLLFVAVFLFLYVLPLGVRPLVIPDEARYAEIPREMLASGDWIVPRLNGLRYFEKPPLGYWLNAASIWLLGANEFAVRLPSATAVGLTAILLFAWARKLSDDRATPLFAVAVFLLSFEVLAVGTFCVLDSVLSLWVTAAIIAFFFAYRAQEFRERVLLLILAGVASGLAFLTKGFLGWAVPVMVIIPFAIWEGRFRTTLRMAWLPLLAALLTALPWSILIHRQEPDFWRYFFWVEHIGRFLSPHGGQHPEPFWYYVPILLAGAMPWTPLLGPIVQGLRKTSRSDSMLRLATCWLVFPLLFFSVCSGKLGTYVLPCYPPLAFLIAVGVLKCLREGDTKGLVIGAWVLMVGAGFLLLTLVMALLIVAGMCDTVTLWKWMIAAAGLFLWIVFCGVATVRRSVHTKIAFYCAGPVLFMFSWHFVFAAALQPRKAPGEFLLSHASGISSSSTFIVENSFVGAVCWFTKRSDLLVTGPTGEFAYGLGYDDSQGRVLDIEQIGNLIARQKGKEPVILVVRPRCYAQYKDQLPGPCREEIRGGLVWAEYSSPASLPNPK